MKRVAFVTCAKLPRLTDSDTLAALELEKLNIKVEAHPWTANCDWNQFDGVIVRGTWDYWEDYPGFLKWIDGLESFKSKVWNQPQTLKWNTDKRYLATFAEAGVPVVPTDWVAKEDSKKLGDIAKREWPEVIIKPVISGGAFQTHRIKKENILNKETQAHLQEIWKLGPCMVQPLMNEILTEGEYSFLYFNGKFSHSILKVGKPNEFRVQFMFGGTSHVYSPTAQELGQIAKILEKVKEPLLYARVDVIKRGGEFLLMELEFTEPHLFLQEDPAAAKRFAEAIKDRLRV